MFEKRNELRKVKSKIEYIQKRKAIANDATSKLFNEQMGKLNDEYRELLDLEKREFHSKYNIIDLFLDGYHNDDLFVLTITPLEGDEEEEKESKGIKILTPNKQ